MSGQTRRFDLILNTVAAPMDLDPYINALALDGVMVLVGAPAVPHKRPAILPFLKARRSIAGSAIGGIAQTQEMLDFCAQNSITADIEVIPIQQINEAYKQMLRGNVKYRVVIDMQSLKDEAKRAIS